MPHCNAIRHTPTPGARRTQGCRRAGNTRGTTTRITRRHGPGIHLHRRARASLISSSKRNGSVGDGSNLKWAP